MENTVDCDVFHDDQYLNENTSLNKKMLTNMVHFRSKKIIILLPFEI